jgi:cation transporter-like permease
MGPAIAALIEALGVAKWAPAIRQVVTMIVAWVGVNLVNTGVRMAIATGVLVGWAGFIAVVVNGRVNFDGDNIFSLLLSNPLSGLPHDMYALLCLVFPFGFFFRMACAYIAWNLTFQGAAILVSRGVKFLFGG